MRLLKLVQFMILLTKFGNRKQQVNNHIHGLFIDIDRQPAMPNSCTVIKIWRRALTIMAANEDSF